MADIGEVESAVAAVRQAGATDLALLHCVSRYPAAPAECNLRAIPTLAEEFEVPVGFSDHTVGISTSLAAVALGASIVEKHLTLDRSLAGPDHASSSLPQEFATMVREIRSIESALGDGVKMCTDGEREIARVARKSLLAARDLATGTVLESSDFLSSRPGTGLPPTAKPRLVGLRLVVDLPAGAPFSEACFE